MRQTLLLIVAMGLVAATAGCQSSLPKSSPSVASNQSHSPLAKLEHSLVFNPTRYPVGEWEPLGLVHEDAWFTSADGTTLHGWYLPHSQPQGVVLYCHGNAGNVALWADTLNTVRNRGAVSVFGFDYRGYGRSEGVPSESGVLADARAARAWLAQRAGVSEGDIIIMGRSLGGGVAVDLAANDGARGLILESTFTSLPEVGHHKAPWFPVRTLMHAQLNSRAKIPAFHGPMLQSHGTADQLIPFAMAQQLHQAANEPKQFVTIPGGDHNDAQTDEYYLALHDFVGKLPHSVARR